MKIIHLQFLVCDLWLIECMKKRKGRDRGLLGVVKYQPGTVEY